MESSSVCNHTSDNKIVRPRWCDWLNELSNKLSDKKLSDNNLASELVEKKEFFKPITIKEIVIAPLANL